MQSLVAQHGTGFRSLALRKRTRICVKPHILVVKPHIQPLDPYPAITRRLSSVRANPAESTELKDGPSPTVQSPVEKVTESTEPSGSRNFTPSKKKRQADSTDGIASFLSRRFGLAGGLGWLAFLAVGSLGEQIKTRIEVANEEKETKEVSEAVEVTLPSGVKYTDLRIGGGSTPIRNYLAVVDYVGKADGEVFEDTKARGKPIVYRWGGRPYAGGLCAGVEEGMANMKAGGRRIIMVPPELGFGASGTSLRPTEHVKDKSGVIPGGAMLEYDVELLRISIPPS